MGAEKYYEFRVRLLKDKATGQIVAEVPALDISDYGPDSQKAFQRLTKMAAFHLECLVAEGKPIPQEKRSGQGLYLRVGCPASAP